MSSVSREPDVFWTPAWAMAIASRAGVWSTWERRFARFLARRIAPRDGRASRWRVLTPTWSIFACPMSRISASRAMVAIAARVPAVPRTFAWTTATKVRSAVVFVLKAAIVPGVFHALMPRPWTASPPCSVLPMPESAPAPQDPWSCRSGPAVKWLMK